MKNILDDLRSSTNMNDNTKINEMMSIINKEQKEQNILSFDNIEIKINQQS